MSGATSPSEPGGSALADAPAPARVSGGVHARFLSDGSRTAVASVAERGGYRLARPTAFGAHLEALLINTGGGVPGGDRIETVYELGTAADVVHTTTSAERIYRSGGAPARLEVRIALAPGARLDWLPQPTILGAGSRLERSIEVDAAEDSRLLMVEMTTFGQPEGEEEAAPASLSDQWHVRWNGRLVYAEAARMSGEPAAMPDRPTIAREPRAAAFALLVASEAADLVEPLRRAIECDACETTVSACNGLLAARAIARSPEDVIAALGRVIPVLSGRALPRVWAT